MRSLTVVDAKGVERVIIGTSVPDPMVRGTRQSRDGSISGIIINGPDGNERGGYATSDAAGGEALLTLDGANGGEVFKVIANPDAGASLFLQHRGGAGVALTTDPGSPELHMFGADGKRVLGVPKGTPPIE